MPDNPLPRAITLLATVTEANLLVESGHGDDATHLLNGVNHASTKSSQSTHCDVRFAQWQFFVRTNQTELALGELERDSLDRPALYLALFGAVDLYRQRRYDEALKYYEIAAKYARESQCRFALAFIRLDLDDPADIRSDFIAELSHREDSVYLGLDWMVLRLLGDSDSARQLGERLQSTMAKLGLSMGEKKSADFAAGVITREELEALTGESRRVDCYLYLMLGVDALAEGNRHLAREYFQKSLDTGYFVFYDYYWAKAFAERLDSDDEWLPWLPVKSTD